MTTPKGPRRRQGRVVDGDASSTGDLVNAAASVTSAKGRADDR
ncbi:hypothetical protein ACFUIY_17815 [Streptomyces griseorubiginosus]